MQFVLNKRQITLLRKCWLRFFAHITFVKGHLDTQGLLVCSSGIVPDGETTFDGVILKSLHYEH